MSQDKNVITCHVGHISGNIIALLFNLREQKSIKAVNMEISCGIFIKNQTNLKNIQFFHLSLMIDLI